MRGVGRRSELFARQADAILRRDFTESAALAQAIAAQRDSVERSFGFLSTSDLSAQLPPVNYVVQALDICPGRPTQITGAGFSGKTVIAQAMLTSIILGCPVWGRFQGRKGSCVHLDYEMGRRLTVERYRRLCLSHGASWEIDVAPFLRVAPLPQVRMNDSDFEHLVEDAARNAVIVLIDSLRRALPGEDENASSISRHIDTLTQVSERTGATFVFLHHSTTKPPAGGSPDGDRRSAGRGSSAIFDASGAVFALRSAAHKPVRVEQTKAAESGICAEPFWLSIEDDDVGGNPRGGLRVIARGDPGGGGGFPQTAEERVMQALRAAGPDGIRGGIAVRDAAGIRGSVTYRVLENLVRTGQVANLAELPQGKPNPRHPRYVAAEFITRPALKGAERDESSADDREEREES